MAGAERVWKCIATLVIGEAEEGEIVTEDRTATDMLLGLHLAVEDLLRKATTLDQSRGTKKRGAILIAWADPISDSGDPRDALRSTRLLDKARAAELRAAEVRKHQQPPA
jgi:hypothetical protein